MNQLVKKLIFLKNYTFVANSIFHAPFNATNVKTIHTGHHTQSRIIGAVRGTHSQLWGTIIPACSLYAARKYDRRFGTPAIV